MEELNLGGFSNTDDFCTSGGKTMRRITKRIWHSLAGFVLAGVLLHCVPATAQSLSLRAATETAKGEETALLIEYLKEGVERLSNGTIKISDFYGGTLGNQRQLQEQVQLGTIEIISTGSDMPELNPRYSTFDLPFLFKDRDHAFRVTD